MELLFDSLLICLECASLYCISKYMPMWHMPGHDLDDPRYSYPFTQDTVTNAFLIKSCFIIPITSFFIFEVIFKKADLKSKIIAFLNQITKCANGILLLLIIGTALKHVTGVPRPYYNAVCQPNTKLNKEDFIHNFIVNDEALCTNSNYHEAIRSFPSLHSGVVFYYFVYLSCYYESRWTLKKFVLLKPILQIAMFLGAVFTSCSRITDFKHHVTDVLAGSVLGVIFAIFLIVSATDFFKSSNIPTTNMNQNHKMD